MNFKEFFEGLTDPRVADNVTYPFEYLMLMALCAALAGIDSCVGIADYAETHAEFFSAYFKLPYTPRHDTFLYILSRIDEAKMELWFRKRATDIRNLLPHIPRPETKSTDGPSKRYNHVSIDGKTVRNSGFNNPFHIVSAWFENEEIVLGQETVEDKSNEIKAIPKLLESIELPPNTLITIDAMGCQKEICQKIIDKGADYLISVKDNQPTLFLSTLTQLEEDFEEVYSEHVSVNKGHGRVEKRVCIATIPNTEKYDFKDWPGLKAIYAIDSDTTVKRRGKEKRYLSTRYFVSSVILDAQTACFYSRKHWGIEVKLHWRLDVVMNEDQACIQEGAAVANMNRLRKMGLNVVNRTRGKQSVASMNRKSMNPSFATKVLEKLFYP